MEHDPTSKFPRRLARDIILSTDVGRDSPFDFFKDRSVTKMMNARNPNEPQDLLFAEKLHRRVPCPVNYNVIPHHARAVVGRLVEEGGLATTRVEDERLNDKGYVKPSYIRNVAFPKAARFDNTAPKNHVQLRKQLVEEREEVLRKEKDKNPPGVRDIVVKPDCSRAPTFGSPFVPPAVSSDAADCRLQRFTQFPWQRRGSANTDGADAETDVHSRRKGRAVASIKAPTGDPGDARSASAPPLLSSAGSPLLGESEEAVWARKNKAALEKHGLIAGGRRERLHQKTMENRSMPNGSGAVNFRLQSSRAAPVGFQPRDKEVNDAFYLPKYDVTTAEPKKVADVRLGRFASRPQGTNVIKAHVDKLLTIDHLSKYYKHHRRLQATSAFRTPDDVGVDDDVFTDQTTGIHKPVSAFDDYSLHPPTPPKLPRTRKYNGTPDLCNYADRPGVPLDALLAGEGAVRRRKAKASLRRDGLL